MSKAIERRITTLEQALAPGRRIFVCWDQDDTHTENGQPVSLAEIDAAARDGIEIIVVKVEWEDAVRP